MAASEERQQALLVIAHPDDESMFFGPCLASLGDEFSWHLLCLSTGNADGLGPQREQELLHACVLLQVQVHRVINDPLLQDGMQIRWDLSQIEHHVAAAVDEVKPTLVLTFDELGVSGHPNHISTHYGVRRWHDQTSYNCRLCFLKTVPLVIKFLGPLIQLLLSLVKLFAGSAQLLQAIPVGRRPGFVLADAHHIAEIQMAMQAHVSQYVWYRRLYMRVSVYTFMNLLWAEHSKRA
eukprot:jgi/Ulvmu1/4507/UM002_0233.1